MTDDKYVKRRGEVKRCLSCKDDLDTPEYRLGTSGDSYICSAECAGQVRLNRDHRHQKMPSHSNDPTTYAK